MGPGPCGRQAASVVASAIRSPSLHVCLACLILCDSEGERGGRGQGRGCLGWAAHVTGVLGSLRHVKQKKPCAGSLGEGDYFQLAGFRSLKVVESNGGFFFFFTAATEIH